MRVRICLRKLLVIIMIAFVIMDLGVPKSYAAEQGDTGGEEERANDERISGVQQFMTFVMVEGDVYENTDDEKIPLKGVNVGNEVVTDSKGHYAIEGAGKHHIFVTLGDINNASQNSGASIADILQFNGHDYSFYKEKLPEDLKSLDPNNPEFFTKFEKIQDDDQENSRRELLEKAFDGIFQNKVQNDDEENSTFLGKAGDRVKASEIKKKIKEALCGEDDKTISNQEFRDNLAKVKNDLLILEKGLSIQEHSVLYRCIIEVLENDVKNKFSSDLYMEAFTALTSVRNSTMTDEEAKYFHEIYDEFYAEVDESKLPSIVLPFIDINLASKISVLSSLDELRESEENTDQIYYSVNDLAEKANDLSKAEKEEMLENLKMFSSTTFANVDFGIQELADELNPYEGMELPHEEDLYNVPGYSRVHVTYEAISSDSADFDRYERELPEGVTIVSKYVYKITKEYYVLKPIKGEGEEPTEPETPSIPETPTEPETPSVPETPTIPETPSLPQLPQLPQTPPVQSMPELIGGGQITIDGIPVVTIPCDSTHKINSLDTKFKNTLLKNVGANGDEEDEDEEITYVEVLDHVETYIEEYYNLSLHHDVVALKEEPLTVFTTSKATGLKVTLNDGTILTNIECPIGSEEDPLNQKVLLEVLDDEIAQGATVQVEFTVQVHNSSPYTITHLELVDYLPKDFYFLPETKLITESATNQSYDWAGVKPEILFKKGLINNKSLDNFKTNHTATVMLDNDNKLENGFFIPAGETYELKITGSRVISSINDIGNNIENFVEVIGYKAGAISGRKEDGTYEKYETRRITVKELNDGKERLLGIYPGDFKTDYDLSKLIVKATDIAEGIDLAKNRNLAIIVPPTKMNNKTLATPVLIAVAFEIAFIVTIIIKKKHIK